MTSPLDRVLILKMNVKFKIYRNQSNLHIAIEINSTESLDQAKINILFQMEI